MRPIENPHRVELPAAHRSGFSGRVPRRKPELRRARAGTCLAPASGRVRERRSGDDGP